MFILFVAWLLILGGIGTGIYIGATSSIVDGVLVAVFGICIGVILAIANMVRVRHNSAKGLSKNWL